MYTLFPDTVDCSEATPATGNMELSLPGNKNGVLHNM